MPVSKMTMTLLAIAGGMVLASVESLSAQDCNGNGVPDEADIAAVPGLDCNHNALVDVCEIDENSTAPGRPFFCDPLMPPGGLPSCDPDCNNNGTPDACDVERRLVGTNPDFYLEMNVVTGAATRVTGLGLGGFQDVNALAFDPNTDTLYGTNGSNNDGTGMHSDQLITIDPTTGAGTPVGALGFGSVLAWRSTRTPTHCTERKRIR